MWPCSTRTHIGGLFYTVSRAVLYGVPQGSVLGPIVLHLYTADLLQLVKRHQLIPHAYADDTQIYGFCRPADSAELCEKVSVCVDEVSAWMASNRLQLNHAKTEVLWCTSSRRQHQIPSCWRYRPPDVQHSVTLPSQWLRHVRGTACRCLPGMHRR